MDAVCLKCGEPAAGATCAKCGNEILAPERHPLGGKASPGQMIGYASLGLIGVLTLVIVGAAIMSVASPALKYVVKARASAVCDCKDPVCVQREAAKSAGVVQEANAELASAEKQVGAEGATIYKDHEVAEVAAALVRLNACSKAGTAQ